jgi:L-aminopeptidase/D-esterase-like protein
VVRKICRIFITVFFVYLPVEAQAQGHGGSIPVGVSIGHATMAGRPTGCTVVLFRDGAVAGVDVRGAAPGTRETDLLSPVNTVQRVHALVLSGGSAFGLDVATGVMTFLEEREVGFELGDLHIPIVPQAILFDLFVGDDPSIRPDADCGYRAAGAAQSETIIEGNVGAGAGATVGKLLGMSNAMKAGLGVASHRFDDGLVISAIVAVNAVGDVVDPSNGRLLAGALNSDGTMADARNLFLDGRNVQTGEGQNTTLGIIVTNATLSKAQATKIAQMGHDGFARTIYPAHTPFDGDVIFAAGTGTWDGEISLMRLGSVSADLIARAVLRAVNTAEGLPGLPAARDMNR